MDYNCLYNVRLFTGYYYIIKNQLVKGIILHAWIIIVCIM